jgi:hypothetical protein
MRAAALLLLCACVSGPPLPRVDRVVPVAARVGAVLDVYGAGFGGDGFVTIGAAPAEAASWSDDHVAVTVPDLAAGATSLVVTVDGRPSNEVALEVQP